MVMPEYRNGEYVFDGTIGVQRDYQIAGTANMNSNVRYFEGVFNVPIYGQGEQILVEIRVPANPYQVLRQRMGCLVTTRAGQCNEVGSITEHHALPRT